MVVRGGTVRRDAGGVSRMPSTSRLLVGQNVTSEVSVNIATSHRSIIVRTCYDAHVASDCPSGDIVDDNHGVADGIMRASLLIFPSALTIITSIIRRHSRREVVRHNITMAKYDNGFAGSASMASKRNADVVK